MLESSSDSRVAKVSLDEGNAEESDEDEERKKPYNPKYLNSPDTVAFRKSNTLFGLGEARRGIRRADCAVLVEGYFDVISLPNFRNRRHFDGIEGRRSSVSYI